MKQPTSSSSVAARRAGDDLKELKERFAELSAHSLDAKAAHAAIRAHLERSRKRYRSLLESRAEAE